MVDRPLINLLNQELYDYYQDNKEDINILSEIVYELSFRNRIKENYKQEILNRFITLSRLRLSTKTEDVKNSGEGFRIKRREKTLGDYGISDVELKILELLCEGLSTKEISKKMSLANGTIRNYRSSIYEKLNVGNRIEAIVKAYKIGLLDLEINAEKVKAILDDYSTSRLITLHYQLSPREIEILELATTGKTYTELARELDISGGTVRNYFSSIYEKLDVNNKVEAVKVAIELGIINNV